MTAHWGIQDPARVAGSEEEQRRAFARAFRELDARIKLFTSLRIDALDELSLQRQLDAIGKTADPLDQRDHRGSAQFALRINL